MKTAKKMVLDWIDKKGYVVEFNGNIEATVNANDIVTLIEGISGQGDNGILLEVQKGIDNTPSEVRGGYSDGFHTFDELYEFRKMYNIALFNEWASKMIYNPEWKVNDGEPGLPKYDVHKSWRHHDGELCFGGGWFIVVALLPTGQISNHYQAQDWDLFKIPAVEKAKYQFDGHTPMDVLTRLKRL